MAFCTCDSGPEYHDPECEMYKVIAHPATESLRQQLAAKDAEIFRLKEVAASNDRLLYTEMEKVYELRKEVERLRKEVGYGQEG